MTNRARQIAIALGWLGAFVLAAILRQRWVSGFVNNADADALRFWSGLGLALLGVWAVCAVAVAIRRWSKGGTRRNLALGIAVLCVFAGGLICWFEWFGRLSGDRGDDYLPSVRCADGAFVFSSEQKARMVKTPLDRELFVRYVESQWPVERLNACCTPQRANLDLQGLVPQKLLFDNWEIPIHEGKNHGFDRLYVYVSEDGGGSRYSGEIATKWVRWEYEVVMKKGGNEWWVIDVLPNDFMDRPDKYLSQ